ncbi:ABC transporter substrate-binding protein [Methylobacterium currus]|uniref:ABC transporter substrate-binding protein n=1 Tax=Methylobacterium currus TaxID=2051553 RepID=A0A2R4WKG3_9HYPH|nr:ABC transporter substrate-binding protein [Methylobacterium currus]AWB22020.1 ABC transporter substrate-binding protein [Methylobacterium currus]
MASLIRTTVLACLALGPVHVAASPASAAEQITFVSQGGAYQQAQTVAILDPAAKALGITINQDSAPDAWPVIRTQGATGKPTWDVVDTPIQDCLRGGKAGLIETLDFSKIPNAAAIPAAYKTEYSVPYEFYSSVLAYNKSKYGKSPPQSWADFWDVKRFPGARALRNHPFATLEAALMADGVTPDTLYPLDVDRAFRKLEEIKPHISVWWTSGGQSALLLQGGEVDMEMIWNGRAAAVIEAGADADYTFNQGVLQNTSLCILKNAPNLATAVKFVNQAIDPKLQANLPLNIPYGPGNPAAFDTGIIPASLAAKLPSAPDNAKKQAVLSAAWWTSEAGDATLKRWAEFVQKK